MARNKTTNIEKIQVNTSISPKAFLLLIFFSLALLIFFVESLLSNFIKTKDYVQVNAEITQVAYRIHYDNGENHTINFMKLKYEYNNNSYQNEQRIAFKFNKKVGNKTKIYINPSNPTEVRDNYIFRSNIFLSIFMLLINIFMIKFYRIRKNLNEK